MTRQLAIAGVLGALLLFEHAPVLPLSDFRVPAFYAEIRDDLGEFTVLELPLAWRNGFRITGTLDKVFMLSQFYQTTHEKRMLSGNTSRNPELKFQYFTEAPVINSLIALETGHSLDEATLARDRTLAPEAMRFFGVRYIVVRPEAGADIDPYLRSVLPSLALWREDKGVRVYRLQHEPDPPSRDIAVTDSLARLTFGEGWGELGAERVWAQRQETRLLIPIKETGQEVRLSLWVPYGSQTVAISVNGVQIGEYTLAAGSNSVRLQVPFGVATRPVDDVHIHWRQLYSTATLNAPSGASHPYVVAKSAGNEVGDFAHIWVDGMERSNNRRGYNAVTVAMSGAATDAFDTFASGNEAQRLTVFLDASARLTLALAVRDEASRNLTKPALARLAGIGAQAKPGWRWSHAFVRVVADDGTVTVREDASPIRPAIAAFGERITSAFFAGALERIELHLPGVR